MMNDERKSSPQVITTPRLIGRRIAHDDLADLTAMMSDAVVMATLGGVRSESETRGRLDEAVAHWREHGYGFWVFRDRADDRFVGRAGLRHVTIEGSGEIELAYALRAEFWNRGLATDVSRAIVDVAFHQLGLAELVAFTLPDNKPSRRVMEKVGFVYERDIVHANLPHVLYRLRRGKP